jgi:hypothetical protein
MTVPRDTTEAIETESRDRLRRLAEQQAALRRVATLVAEGAPADELERVTRPVLFQAA